MAKGSRWRNDGLRSGSNTRYAGDGIISDDYSEESGNKKRFHSVMARFPLDKCAPESLNGPVIIVQEGRKKDG